MDLIRLNTTKPCGSLACQRWRQPVSPSPIDPTPSRASPLPQVFWVTQHHRQPQKPSGSVDGPDSLKHHKTCGSLACQRWRQPVSPSSLTRRHRGQARSHRFCSGPRFDNRPPTFSTPTTTRYYAVDHWPHRSGFSPPVCRPAMARRRGWRRGGWRLAGRRICGPSFPAVFACQG